MAEKIVIALGGNALQSGSGQATAEEQLEVVKKTCEHVAEISSRGYEIAVVHGNGPQVGRILLASETAKDSGEGAIATKLQFAGKTSVLVVMMPVIRNLITVITNTLMSF